MTELLPLHVWWVEWADSGGGLLAFGVFGKLSRILSWTRESVRDRGVATTLKVALSALEDSCFDWRHGTETGRVVDSDQFEATLANRGHAVRYKATKARPFLALLRHLRLPEGSVFVDIGSGKGRVLLLAAQQHFRRVLGVEFSPSLCELARRNIDIFRRRARSLAPIEVIQADITQHEWRGDENVFFLYNPFDAVILARFVENLRRSVAASPRRVWLIYSAPVHTAVLGESGIFKNRDTASFWGTEFHIYSNEVPGRAVSGEGAA